MYNRGYDNLKGKIIKTVMAFMFVISLPMSTLYVLKKMSSIKQIQEQQVVEIVEEKSIPVITVANAQDKEQNLSQEVYPLQEQSINNEQYNQNIQSEYNIDTNRNINQNQNENQNIQKYINPQCNEQNCINRNRTSHGGVWIFDKNEPDCCKCNPNSQCPPGTSLFVRNCECIPIATPQRPEIPNRMPPEHSYHRSGYSAFNEKNINGMSGNYTLNADSTGQHVNGTINVNFR